MACAWVRLAAAGANAAEWEAGNTYTWVLVIANARGESLRVVLIPAASFTKHCCPLLMRECPLITTGRQQSLRLFTLHHSLR